MVFVLARGCSFLADSKPDSGSAVSNTTAHRGMATAFGGVVRAAADHLVGPNYYGARGQQHAPGSPETPLRFPLNLAWGVADARVQDWPLTDWRTALALTVLCESSRLSVQDCPPARHGRPRSLSLSIHAEVPDCMLSHVAKALAPASATACAGSRSRCSPMPCAPAAARMLWHACYQAWQWPAHSWHACMPGQPEQPNQG